MNSIVIRYKAFWLAGIIILLGCWACALILMCNGEAYAPFILLGIVLAAPYGYLGTLKDEFSEAGIRVGSGGKPKFYRWEDVLQVGIYMVSYWKSGSSPHLAFTFKGGSPRTYGQKFISWHLHNPQTSLYVPYSKQLHTMVLTHYGPLDFDLSGDGPEQSTIVD